MSLSLTEIRNDIANFQTQTSAQIGSHDSQIESLATEVCDIRNMLKDHHEEILRQKQAMEQQQEVVEKVRAQRTGIKNGKSEILHIKNLSADEEGNPIGPKASDPNMPREFFKWVEEIYQQQEGEFIIRLKLGQDW